MNRGFMYLPEWAQVPLHGFEWQVRLKYRLLPWWKIKAQQYLHQPSNARVLSTLLSHSNLVLS